MSPAFYVDLVKSRTILGAVTESTFVATIDGKRGRGKIADLYGIRDATSADRRDDAIKRLSRDILATATTKTGVVSVAVTSPSPELAAQINGLVLNLIDQFNLTIRRSQASAERRFTEARVAEAQQNLRTTEDQLQFFLQSNREFRNSPVISAQYDRLQREVLLRQQLFSTLVQALEKAKIDEVRDTPVISVVERPEVPVRPNRRGTVGKLVTAMLIGSLLGLLVSLGSEALRTGEDPLFDPEQREFRRLLAGTLSDLRRPWRLAFGKLRRERNKR
jgi:uncharacterized protein involved in exopolysaccharide biosynthesis